MDRRIFGVVNTLRSMAIGLDNKMATCHLAAVLSGKKILAYGGNHNRCCVNGCITSSVHAEQDAILTALRLLDKSGSLYRSTKLNAKKEWCFLRVPAF